jgi:glycosyltransferase involved in cell wall biosynthesis
MKKQFRDFPSMKIVTISNCYSSDIDNIPFKKTKTDSTVKLLYLSNVMESKGITFLLEACDKLLEMYPNLSLCIAGSFFADEFSSLEKITQRFYKLYNHLKQKYPTQIDYKGIVYGETKIELLWNSDIFILPTFYPTEAFPISIIEAMRTGNYIISTNHNLLPEIVNYNNGILIEPQSSEAIINAVSDICSDKERLKEVQYFNIGYAIQNYQECKYLDSVLSLIKTK